MRRRSRASSRPWTRGKHEAAAAHAKADEARRLNKSETHAVSDEDARAAEELAKAADAAAAGEEAKLRPVAAGRPLDRCAAGGERRGRQGGAAAEAQDGLRECTVRAPVKGVVERMLVSAGQALGPNPQQPAVMFAADGPRIVRAEVEQEWASHVAVGMAATVQDFSATGTTWHGHVTRLSDWYTHRRSILMEPLQFNDVRTLECDHHAGPRPAAAAHRPARPRHDGRRELSGRFRPAARSVYALKPTEAVPRPPPGASRIAAPAPPRPSARRRNDTPCGRTGRRSGGHPLPAPDTLRRCGPRTQSASHQPAVPRRVPAPRPGARRRCSAPLP